MPYWSVFRPELFKDRIVLVTGAGSGIGRCSAHELAALGAHVVLIGRQSAPLEQTAAEIAEDGGVCSVFRCNIRKENLVRDVIRAVLDRHGRIDGLVNNAGGQFPAPLAQIGKKGWDAVIETNLTGGFLMARECYTQWMADHGGAIVNIVADMWMGMPGMGHSGAARAGMVNFTETAASEWGPSGVRVNAVAPGWIASSGLDTYPDAMKKVIRTLPRHVPLGRLGNEAEVSAAIAFLLSEAAAFINGACLRIDGGAPNARRHWPLVEPSARARERSFAGFHRASPPALFSGGED